MKCRQVRKRLPELFDAVPDPALSAEVVAHLEICPQCVQEYQTLNETLEALRPAHQVSASPDFKEQLMNKISESNRSNTVALRPKVARRRLLKPALAAGLAVLVLVAASFGMWYTQTGGNPSAPAFKVLGQAVHAMANLQSVHIKARMRTLPRDNFGLIWLDGEFYDHDLWMQFGEPRQWRVEKTGRVVVMDGESSLLWIKPDKAVEGGRGNGFVGWLLPLMEVDQVLESELQSAQQDGADISLVHEIGPDGFPELVLYVEAAAQGDFTNDWCLNRSITESDNLRVYRLDAETKYLKGAQVFVRTEAGEEVLVFETTAIEYDAVLDPALFALELPEDVSWITSTPILPDNAVYAAMTPKQVARAFFEACGEEDWEEVQKFYPISPIPEKTKNYMGGLELLKLGTPFQSGLYPGWFVPYEIRNKWGTKKMNLAVRNDNPAKRYMVDGGF